MVMMPGLMKRGIVLLYFCHIFCAVQRTFVVAAAGSIFRYFGDVATAKISLKSFSSTIPISVGHAVLFGDRSAKCPKWSNVVHSILCWHCVGVLIQKPELSRLDG